MIEAVVVKNTVPLHMDAAEEAMPIFTGKLSDKLVDYIAVYAPRDTTELANSFEVAEISDEEHIVASDAEHAEWVRTGTGVYGPHGEPIQPTQAHALKFDWRKMGGATTVWKGNLHGSAEKAEFSEWARDRAMVPFVVWPRGMEGRDYVTPSIESTEREGESLLEDSLEQTGAK